MSTPPTTSVHDDKGTPSPIPFDDWVRRIFSREIDSGWWSPADTDWDDLPPEVAIDYLTQVFEQSSQLLQPYSDEQVDQGLWFIVGCGGEYAYALTNLDIPWANRLRCVRSILRLFEMFTARCSPHLSHSDEPCANPLNSICYMFWDIVPVHGQPSEPEFADLDHSLLAVMTEILSLPSDASRESALHGLGHWQSAYPAEVEQIINSFLAANPTIRPELRLYAEQARSGNVL